MNKSPSKIILIGIILILAATVGIIFFTKDNKKSVTGETIIDLTSSKKDSASAPKDSADKAENSNSEINLTAVGDIIMSRHVGVKIKESGDNALPFRKVSDILSAGDITFGDLEAPFLNQGDLITEGMSFKAEPEFIEGIKLAGFDVMAMANNHTKNQGPEGLLFTFDLLNQNNIKFCGAGKNFAEAHQPAILESKGKKFAFLAYTYSDGIDFQTHLSENEPDVAFWDANQAKIDIDQAKTQADSVIVYMHAGQEYSPKPIQDQINFAHSAIDNGADLVLGSHPHWVETTEKYKDKYIIYSMGNFVFDQDWSQETKEGVIVKLKYKDNRFNQAEFIPVIIEDFNQPRVANDAEKSKIFNQMELKSSVINF
ncbi:MAG: CapA family protein [Patescibacteria group bacterium]|jgi:poly-gamma-glutamate synthesis protein (capsule biosynthesis protein)